MHTTDMKAPFDTALLDELMGEAGIDVLLATSKHNVQYLLGGHRAMFFDYMDAMGVSRYLPVLVYPRGAPERAFYVGHRTESGQKEVAPFWTESDTSSWGSVDSIEKAVAQVTQRGLLAGTIGVETSFLPYDSAQTLERLLPASKIVNALDTLERLRMRKSPTELTLLRESSERVIQSMGQAFEACRAGMTKKQLVQVLREAETERGLIFEYCLITAGAGLNRAASDYVIQPGDIMSLDSGANYHGYIGDICRMGIVGEPDAELEDALAFVDRVQHAAFKAAGPGAMGGDLYAAPQKLIDASPWASQVHFVAHGMGLVSHEAPHLSKTGPVPYGDEDAYRGLEPGAVLSIETTLRHPTRGFIKLEDTVAVTAAGHEVFGASMRGWTRTGGKAPKSLAA